MNTLLIEVLQWMQNNGYRRASFDRLVGIIPSASTYDQLNQLVMENPDIFREATIKGGLLGLALLDEVNTAEELAALRENDTSRPSILNVPDSVLNTDSIVTEYSPAPKVTTNDVELEIANEYYRNLGGAVKANPTSTTNNVTLCVLELQNGFVIVGKSACVYPENFNEEIGRRLAREDALRQVGTFLGFRLADKRTQVS